MCKKAKRFLALKDINMPNKHEFEGTMKQQKDIFFNKLFYFDFFYIRNSKKT